MGVVAGGAADVADEPAEDGAGHRPPVVSLQVVRAGEERVKESVENEVKFRPLT